MCTAEFKPIRSWCGFKKQSLKFFRIHTPLSKTKKKRMNNETLKGKTGGLDSVDVLFLVAL